MDTLPHAPHDCASTWLLCPSHCSPPGSLLQATAALLHFWNAPRTCCSPSSFQDLRPGVTFSEKPTETILLKRQLWPSPGLVLSTTTSDVIFFTYMFVRLVTVSRPSAPHPCQTSGSKRTSCDGRNVLYLCCPV